MNDDAVRWTEARLTRINWLRRNSNHIEDLGSVVIQLRDMGIEATPRMLIQPLWRQPYFRFRS